MNTQPPPETVAQDSQPRSGAWGGGYVGGWIVVLLVVVIGLAALSLYGVWTFWPSESGTATTPVIPPKKIVHFFWYHRLLSRESLFFVMVAFAGALGGMVHSLRSLAVYVGNRELRWSWIPFYVLKPVLGAVLATLLYFVLRAGLFSPSASTQQASPYGFAAIAALAGLFSDQAVEKLRKVAEEVFEKLPPGKDSVAALPLAKTGTVRATGPTEASVAGTVNPRGQQTTVQFQYGQTQEYDSVTPTVSAGEGQVDRPVDAVLTGLTADTTYHCRVAATNSAGTSYGDDQEFKTPLESGPPAAGAGATAGADD